MNKPRLVIDLIEQAFQVLEVGSLSYVSQCITFPHPPQ
jgi:hypothetical protein